AVMAVLGVLTMAGAVAALRCGGQTRRQHEDEPRRHQRVCDSLHHMRVLLVPETETVPSPAHAQPSGDERHRLRAAHGELLHLRRPAAIAGARGRAEFCGRRRRGRRLCRFCGLQGLPCRACALKTTDDAAGYPQAAMGKKSTAKKSFGDPPTGKNRGGCFLLSIFTPFTHRKLLNG